MLCFRLWRDVIGHVIQTPFVTIGRGVIRNVQCSIDLTSELINRRFILVYRLKMAHSPHVCFTVLQNFAESGMKLVIFCFF